jgi:hypothetical protein
VAYFLCFCQIGFTTPERAFRSNAIGNVRCRTDDLDDLVKLVEDGMAHAMDIFRPPIQEQQSVVMREVTPLANRGIEPLLDGEPVHGVNSFESY